MYTQSNKRVSWKFITFSLLLFVLTISLTCCNNKEKYDKTLNINNPESSKYKDCTPFIRTVLLPKRKVITTIVGPKNMRHNAQLIVKGDNLIAYYYYNNNLDRNCGIIDGWYEFAAYLEFVNFHPQLEREYILPHKNLNIYTSSKSSWEGSSSFFPQKSKGKIIFHEFTEDQINFSLLLFGPNEKHPHINGRKFNFKSIKETLYTEKEIEPLIKIKK